MADDPYKLLGVSKNASKDEIRKAYRKLAKELHPDVRPGDKAAEDKFKAATTAFNILSDPDKRARFDRGEIDAEGNERGPFAGGGPRPGGRQQGYSYSSHGAGPGGGGFEDIGDIFADLFGRGGGGGGPGRGRGGFRTRGDDVRYKLDVDFLDAARGATKSVTMADGKSLNLKIPAGIETGKTLRLKGQGHPGAGGGPSGDALVEVRVKDHPTFTREGDDIRVELPITLKEAVEGAKVATPTIDGAVNITVPKNSNTGSVLRLRGKGVERQGKRGDQFVRLKVVLPDNDPELARFVEGWTPKGDYNPRKGMAG